MKDDWPIKPTPQTPGDEFFGWLKKRGMTKERFEALNPDEKLLLYRRCMSERFR